jgi:transposase
MARVIDHIRANAYQEAMEEGATFINRKWIARKLHRSERWVTDNWKKGYEHCFMKFGDGRPEKLSEESKNIVIENSGKRQRSCKRVAKDIFEKRGRSLVRQLYNDIVLNKG